MKTCDLTHTAPEREPRQPLRQTIGQAIQRACRAALRLGLGQVRLALEDCSYWMGELHSLDEQRAAVGRAAQALHDRRDSLSIPTPTRPIDWF